MNLSSAKLSQPIDALSFRPFGQVIYPTADGTPWSDRDATLDLTQGTPRVYIMTLPYQGLTFQRMTYHDRCTQCLAAIDGGEWFLGVARRDIPPDRLAVEDVVIFRIRGHCLIKLEAGTWHAGPYFERSEMNFFNLELKDTNITDHHCVDLPRSIVIQ